MKKKIAILMSSLMLAISLSGCGNSYIETTYDPNAEEQVPSMFVSVEMTEIWLIVYHKDTKVMYAVSKGGYNAGNFTLLVDENDNPMLYKGE